MHPDSLSVPQDASRSRTAADLSQLLHLIYEAAIQPERWSGVVAAVADSVDANKGLLFTPYLGPQDGGLVFPWNISEADLQLWATRYIEHDIWSAAVRDRGLWQDGAVSADEGLVPREVLEQSLYFREYLCRVGIGRLCGCVVFAGEPGLPATALSLYRPLEAAPFSRDDEDWLRLVVPHLSRAMGVMYRLDTARLQAASLHSALDRLSFGVALLNERREVLHLNEAARTAMARGDGLVVNGRRQLDTLHREGGATSLPQWLDAVRALDLHEPAHFSQSFSVARGGTPHRHYELQCSPLTASSSWAAQGETARFVVFITDPGATAVRCRTAEGDLWFHRGPGAGCAPPGRRRELQVRSARARHFAGNRALARQGDLFQGAGEPAAGPRARDSVAGSGGGLSVSERLLPLMDLQPCRRPGGRSTKR